MAKKVIVTEEQWTQLRLEYISSTEVSMRGLQKKYGIPFNQIRNRVEQEKWQEQREAIKSKSMQKSIDLISDFKAEQIERAMKVGNDILDKVEESLKDINRMIAKTVVTVKEKKFDDKGGFVETTTTKEEFGTVDVGIDRAGLKQLSSVLRDLKEIGLFRAELDRQEQEARINKLRKDAEEEEADNTIIVQFASGIEEYGD